MKIKLTKKTKIICSVILALAAVGFLIFLEINRIRYAYLISILERSVIYAVVAVSMNMLNGFTGLFSLGQAGFMAIGAYTVAIFTIPSGMRTEVYYISGINPVIAGIEVPFIIALIAGGLFAALVALLIGIPVLRL
jgi:branched-chain amino acid transport system permease protein